MQEHHPRNQLLWRRLRRDNEKTETITRFQPQRSLKSEVSFVVLGGKRTIPAGSALEELWNYG